MDIMVMTEMKLKLKWRVLAYERCDLLKKYELINQTFKYTDDKFCHAFYQIRALRDFGDVKKGELGGFVEYEHNLSHDGDCWVYGNAKVFENAWISGNAQITGDAQISGNAIISGNAQISGNTTIYGNAKISGYSTITGNSKKIKNTR